MKRTHWVQTFGIAALAGMTCASASALPPFFTQHSPQSVIVDVNAGQNSFECTGTAIDFDAADIVHLYTAPLPSFMAIEIHDGNPATFRLYGNNLTGANYGGYFVSVFSEDRFGAQNGEAISFAIGIVPEPTSICFLAFVARLTSRRR